MPFRFTALKTIIHLKPVLAGSFRLRVLKGESVFRPASGLRRSLHDILHLHSEVLKCPHTHTLELVFYYIA